MNIIVTGSDGFISKNLISKIDPKKNTIFCFNRNTPLDSLFEKILEADFILHFAGENRPGDNNDFNKCNFLLTKKIVDFICEKKLNKIKIIFSSTIKVGIEENEYSISKANAEKILLDLSKNNGNIVSILRLPNIFGKWSRPNYNSVVATFCFNTVHSLENNIHDPHKLISLFYIDDLVNFLIEQLNFLKKTIIVTNFNPIYKITLSDLDKMIKSFYQSRISNIVGSFGHGFQRALYSTFLSFVPIEKCSYSIDDFKDPRGMFCEFIKTKNSGQVSFFTINVDNRRGGHYHHTKNEKFLVISGKARFNFKHIITNDIFSIDVNHENMMIVETIPGWAHEIINVGNTRVIALLWANEIFDQDQPDTYFKNNISNE